MQVREARTQVLPLTSLGLFEQEIETQGDSGSQPVMWNEETIL